MPLMPMPPSRAGDPGTAAPVNAAGGTQPGPDSSSDQVEQANEAQAPVEFDLHIKAMPSEITDAVQLLKQAGLDSIASELQKALQPQQGNEDSTSSLQDEIAAMDHNPHGM